VQFGACFDVRWATVLHLQLLARGAGTGAAVVIVVEQHTTTWRLCCRKPFPDQGIPPIRSCKEEGCPWLGEQVLMYRAVNPVHVVVKLLLANVTVSFCLLFLHMGGGGCVNQKLVGK